MYIDHINHTYYKLRVGFASSLSDESRKGLAPARQPSRGRRFVINWTVNRLVSLLVAIAFLAALGTARAQVTAGRSLLQI
jgi:hypothetical protein